ncbi:Uma2 family endonuclease [Stenomitos frigidus AS-A4]|uniref:Uma2 family endonuclease n=1 Tax=Stenomitos frigidus AS-A4 TaxID=2933935 RepID=A0ABV0KLZ5_9CYAN
MDGEVFVLPGGSKPHNRIALNLATALDGYLQDKGCELYMADVKVQASQTSTYHYPDLVVTCDRRDQNSNQFVQHSCLIIEVLSPSTEAYDRGSKFACYRKLETLQEYVLIESTAINVECFQRNAEGFWVLHPYEAGVTITLESIGFSLAIDTLYRQVRFDETAIASDGEAVN